MIQLIKKGQSNTDAFKSAASGITFKLPLKDNFYHFEGRQIHSSYHRAYRD